MTIKSSYKRGRQILGIISPSQAERLLKDWANLRGEWPRVEDENALREILSSIKRMHHDHPGVFEDCPSIPAVVMREFLRKAWAGSDLRHRDWYIFKFRDFYHQTVRRVQEVRADQVTGSKLPEMPAIIPSTRNEALESTGSRNDPPPITPIEAAAFYFQRNLNRARYCAGPECSAPYFFVKKKGQKYCSPDCAQPVQRESKRKWWQENRAKSKRRKQK